ncbi:MAG: methyltransferase domain-containing protein [Verrucomicrobiota bacterium]
MTSASFSKAARNYHRHAQVQTALAGWLAEWVPAERTGRALEVGAGPGVFTAHLAGWPGGVTATDLSPVMCVVGREAVPQADWRVMAAERPLQGPWDGIFSSSMLQWAPEPASIFAAWRAQLAPGGRVLAALFAAGSLPEWRTVAGEDGPVQWRTADEWRAALVGGGLSVVRDTVKLRDFAHPTARDFLRSLHGVGAAPVRRLAPGTLRNLLHRYEERFAAPGGGVRATWMFYRFEAVGME